VAGAGGVAGILPLPASGPTLPATAPGGARPVPGGPLPGTVPTLPPTTGPLPNADGPLPGTAGAPSGGLEGPNAVVAEGPARVLGLREAVTTAAAAWAAAAAFCAAWTAAVTAVDVAAMLVSASEAAPAGERSIYSECQNKTCHDTRAGPLAVLLSVSVECCWLHRK
jgi:hypothetical protein